LEILELRLFWKRSAAIPNSVRTSIPGANIETGTIELLEPKERTESVEIRSINDASAAVRFNQTRGRLPRL